MASPYVIKHEAATSLRVEKYLSDVDFTSCNLRGRLYPLKEAIKGITHFPSGKIVPYEEAVKGTYKPITIPSTYGPLWATHWFRLPISVPRDWLGKEVRLLWRSNAEAMVWEAGQPKQGLSGFPMNMVWREYILTASLTEDQLSCELYIEMSCNGVVGQPGAHNLDDPDPNTTFTLDEASLVVLDRDVFDLYYDLHVLHMMATMLPSSSHRRSQALYAANAMINIVRLDDRETYGRARDIAKKFFSQKNGDSQFVLHAMGHCHIDSAWLWSYDETVRKCARSWATALRLMDQYPEMVFVCSQAQQFAWVQEHYPGLFARIKKAVQAGRFIPVGGAWVEMDGNLPSGESFVRQILYGQRYFQKEFGITCKEFWLPDTFGYSSQLPQLCQSGGMPRFVTQKISWSVNKFPHHTFWWEGLDGSEVLTHFPPGDCYHMSGSVKEIQRTLDNCEDKGRCYNSAYLYGYGDGGGGVTEVMLERLRRLEDVDGVPRMKHSTPEVMFQDIEARETNICRWVGELYLEFHQGTYTSQAKTKKYNRQCQTLLQNAEFLASVSQALGLSAYPRDALESFWRDVLLNQFHDVLPGSSIGKVYEDTDRIYEAVVAKVNRIVSENTRNILSKLLKTVDLSSLPPPVGAINPQLLAVINSTGYSGDTVGEVDGKLVLVNTKSYGFYFGYGLSLPEGHGVKAVSLQNGGATFSNRFLVVKLDRNGRITSLKQAHCDKEAIVSGSYGNQFVMFDDAGAYYDAWDVNHYHLETRRTLDDVIEPLHVTREDPLMCQAKCALRLSPRSRLDMTISLDATSRHLAVTCTVDWDEDHQFLKVEFPLTIRSPAATYEVQYGHLQRPTHWNTKEDWMKFEVPAQRWADLSEHDFGVAILNDCKHGYSTHGGNMRLSLLKSAKKPDKAADIGRHTFSYGIMPHSGTIQTAQVIREADLFNNPPRFVPLSKNTLLAAETPSDQTVSQQAPRGEVSIFDVGGEGVVLDNVKCSEEDSSVLILRLYESFGGRSTAKIRSLFTIADMKECDILEQPVVTPTAPQPTLHDNVITVTLAPFKVITIALKVK